MPLYSRYVKVILLNIEALLADRGHNTNAIIQVAVTAKTLDCIVNRIMVDRVISIIAPHAPLLPPGETRYSLYCYLLEIY
jgi:hypothetical protein